MKKILFVFAALTIAFFGIWTLKLRQPLNPSDPYASGLNDGRPWWESAPGETPTPDADWVLDPEIPQNYIPVLGGEELYMVIDENGNVVKYRHRIRQEDGSWLWEDIDPNIPQNYVPVEGLKDVYMVTDLDGTVHYYKYTRNSDDTYFFTEVDANGNPLADPVQESVPKDNNEIPLNYVRIDGTNIYAVYNEHGVLIGYRERVQNEDGSYSWVDVDPPAASQGGSTNEWLNLGIPTVSLPPMNQQQPLQPNGGQVQTQVPSGTGGNISIIDNSIQTEKGYRQQESYTDQKHENGWVIVYETIVTKEYDGNGDLISTKKEGPTEINRYPESEVSSQLSH